MSNFLIINSSAALEGSASRELLADAVSTIRAASPHATIVERDVGMAPPPLLTPGNLAGIRGVPSTTEEVATRALSDALIRELREADTVVVGAPMYNFGVPGGLRSWFDHVLRAGETFSYSEAGATGLLGGRQVVVVETRGGSYVEGPTQAMDFQEPYLRQLFGFMGITDVTFIHAERIGYGPEMRDAAVEAARSALSQLLITRLKAAA